MTGSLTLQTVCSPVSHAAVLLAASLVLLSVSSCDSSSSVVHESIDTYPTRIAGVFRVRPLADQCGGGLGSADYELNVTATASDTVVELRVEAASDLKAAYVEVSFDASEFALSETVVSDALLGGKGLEGTRDTGLLTITKEVAPGKLVHGQVLIHPQDQSGFSGSGTLTTFRFRRVQDPESELTVDRAQRSVAEVPTDDRSAALLSLDTEAELLSWYCYHGGDYNQDGVVTVSDLTPLGIHFGKTGAFDVESMESVVDGDGNGEIGISDITPIGQDYGTAITHYLVYCSNDPPADYPAFNAEAPRVGALTVIPFSDSIGHPAAERIRFQYGFSGGDEHWDGVWVRPADKAVNWVGTPSNLVLTNGGAPHAVLTSDVPGGVVPLEIELDASASYDYDGEIVLYQWDFDGDGHTDSETTETGSVRHLYGESGVVGCAVTVVDDEGMADSATITLYLADVNIGGPQAVIDASPLEGYAPLAVRFDASASTDPDDNILLYEWDFTTYYDPLAEGPVVEHTFTGAGSYRIALTVTDAGGLTDTAEVTLSTKLAWPWEQLVSETAVGAPQEIALVDAPSGPLLAYSYEDTAKHVRALSLQDLPDSVSVGYAAELGPLVSVRFAVLGGTEGPILVHPSTSDDTEGLMISSYNEPLSQWESEDVLCTYGAVGEVVASSGSGRSWIAYKAEATGEGAIHVMLSEDGGSSWTPMSLDCGSWPAGASEVLLAIAQADGGEPALAYFDPVQSAVVCAAADNPGGTSWRIGTALAISPDDLGDLGICWLDGMPVVVCSNSSTAVLSATRPGSPDLESGTWEQAEITSDCLGEFSVTVIDGQGSIAYVRASDGAVMHARAKDLPGTQWRTDVVAAAEDGPHSDVALLGSSGYAACSCYNDTTGSILLHVQPRP